MLSLKDIESNFGICLQALKLCRQPWTSLCNLLVFLMDALAHALMLLNHCGHSISMPFLGQLSINFWQYLAGAPWRAEGGGRRPTTRGSHCEEPEGLRRVALCESSRLLKTFFNVYKHCCFLQWRPWHMVAASQITLILLCMLRTLDPFFENEIHAHHVFNFEHFEML